MAEGYNALEGSQTDINRRILRRLDALEASEPYDDTAIKARIKAVEEGKLSLDRYQRYVRLYLELKEIYENRF